MNEPDANASRPRSDTGAYTLIELLVVVAVAAILTTVALASSHVSNEHVLRSQCVSNLRELGVGLTIYAAESNATCCPSASLVMRLPGTPMRSPASSQAPARSSRAT